MTIKKHIGFLQNEENESEKKEVKPSNSQIVLDAYFENRKPEPSDGFDLELMSTRDIADNLREVLEINNYAIIVSYMEKSGFKLQECEDGKVRWRIYHRCIFKQNDID